MHSSIAIDIDAPPDLVFGLARDVERWADLLPHYARSTARERRPDATLVADFIARRPLISILGIGLPVAWRSRTWAEPAARRLRFIHVAGATRGMDVTWHIEPTATGCHVRIEHDFAPRLPGFARVVDRWFTRPIAGRTLATFKAIAEAVATAPLADPGTGAGPVAAPSATRR
jgi:ribosome-associated toxin RatA of RatAB toxin-antitoxin module